MIERGRRQQKQQHENGWSSIPCHHHSHHQRQPPVVCFYICWFLDFINILSSLVWRPQTMAKYCKFFFCLQFFCHTNVCLQKDRLHICYHHQHGAQQWQKWPKMHLGALVWIFFLLFYYTNVYLLLNRWRWWPTWSPAPDNIERSSRRVCVLSPQVTFHFLKCIVCLHFNYHDDDGRQWYNNRWWIIVMTTGYCDLGVVHCVLNLFTGEFKILVCVYSSYR